MGSRYRVKQLVGRGGMGEVYEAVDLELGVRVALKTIRGERAGSARAVQRFKRELALARQVTHANVCRVFDIGFHRHGEGGFVAFLTMEWLPGPTLAERIARDGPLPLSLASMVMRDLARALDAAHAVGIIHRDLKSQNIIVARGPGGWLRPVITDFGLASFGGTPVVADFTMTGGLRGTPAYMAPEQLSGKKATAASDLFALGVVMFEMVTGRLPSIGDLGPAEPQDRALPLTWWQTIRWLLAPCPSARPRSASEAIDALLDQAPPGEAGSGGARRPRGTLPARVRAVLTALVLAASGFVFPRLAVRSRDGAPASASISLAGRWRGPGQPNLIIEQAGTTLNVRGFSPVRGPFRGTISGQAVEVDFHDDLALNCCSGTVTADHNAIIWSNHTTWRRQP